MSRSLADVAPVPRPYVVILAGGKGTRFWPMSTPERPKQFIPLFDHRSLLASAVDRVLPVVGEDRVWIATDAALEELARADVPSVPADQFAIEPAGRNTLPCIATTCTRIREVDADAVVVILCADHLIRREEVFRRLLMAAATVARTHETLVTFGIEPSRPETGYGYVRRGASLDTVDGFPVYHIAGFTEKPATSVAEAYVADGSYFWNSGMFVWHVATFFEELGRHRPDMVKRLRQMGTDPQDFARHYAELEAVSVDYGLMEKADNVSVIPVDLGWDDVGSWDSVWAVWERDAQGNAVRGTHVGVDTRNCLVFGGDRPVVTLGVEDLIVVDSEAGVLVCPRHRAQEVRDLVARLDQKSNE